MVSVSLENLRSHLDERITAWRRNMDAATDDYAVEACGHMIDAYQEVRQTFIGAKLEAPEQ
jgi:hypothetical protein